MRNWILLFVFVFSIGAGVSWWFKMASDQTTSESSSENSEGELVRSVKALPVHSVESEFSKEELSSQALEREPAQESRLRDTLARLDPQGSWNITSHADGRSSEILGGRIRFSNPAQATQILKEIAMAEAGGERDLQPSESGFSNNAFTLEHFYRGHPVFRSWIKGFATAQRNEIYHVTMDLRQIREANLNERVAAEQAAEAVRRRFGLSPETKVRVAPTKWLFGRSATDNFLVWRVQYSTIGAMPDSREVLVSALTGDVVYHRPMSLSIR